MIVLAGDIGGTHSRLAFYEARDEQLIERAIEIFHNDSFASLGEVLKQFLQTHALTPNSCCLGVAGPVLDGRAVITNLPWIVEAREIQRSTGADFSELINDLEATAYGLSTLADSDFATLHAGESSIGNACVIAAGTGLGEAGLVWQGKDYLPVACEGGHASFAPLNDEDVALWRFLNGRHQHVSWERVISGMGLVSIYEFLCAQDAARAADDPLEDRLHERNAPSLISQAALKHAHPLAVKALDIFVRAYAAEAANLALKWMARGGVYLAGGIAPKILARLQQPDFVEIFLRKGRMGELLKKFPVKVVLSDRVALRGAAWRAAHWPIRS